jgi:hypothetical protein
MPQPRGALICPVGRRELAGHGGLRRGQPCVYNRAMYLDLAQRA